MLKRFFFLLLVITLLASGASAFDGTNYATQITVNNLVLPDLNVDAAIALFDVDFSLLNLACGDLNDLRVVNADTGIDLNRHVEGTITSTDGNIFFNSDEALSAGTFDGKFLIYTNNASCFAPENKFKYKLVDPLDSSGDWTPVSVGGATNTFVSSPAIRGTSWRMLTDGTDDDALNYYRRSFPTPGYGTGLGWWWQVSNVAGESATYLYNGGNLLITVGLKSTSPPNVNGTNFATSFVSNEWYFFSAARITDTTSLIKVFDANLLLLEEFPITLNGVTTWGDETLLQLNAVDNLAIQWSVYWEQIQDLNTYDANSYSYILDTTSIDLNLSTINGFSWSGTIPDFAYVLDGNLAIDFNFLDETNRRHTVDINYSDTNVLGTGTEIVKDLNLDASICDSIDWNVTPTHCSWDFNIQRNLVADGTYYILIKTFGASDISEKSFNIANDVNLTIKIPIDEQTNEVIDTDTYSYNVKYWADGILYSYPNQTDSNSYQIPLSSDYLIFSIDTNVSTQYWGRQYSLKYLTPQATDTLQPYLPPITTSVLTTLHTVSSKNLQALPGLRVKVYKTLETGRTLINDSITDGKGETAIPFVISQLYEIEIWNSDSTEMLFEEEYTTTATTSNHYIYLTEETDAISFPILPNISVRFLPAIKTFNTKDVNIVVEIASTTESITGIQVILQNNDVNIWDSGMDLSAPSDGNTYSINMHDIVFDENHAVNAIVIVQLVGGEEMFFNEDSWWFVFLGFPEDSFFWLITVGLRQDFGCNSEDLGVTCEPLMFIAIFLIFFIVGALAIGAFRNGVGLAIIAIILAATFVYFTWLPFWIGGMMAITGIIVIFAKSRLD